MSEERYIKLIDKEISGTITPGEKAELDEYLSKSPDARRLYDQHIQTLNLLDGVSDVEPPVHLKTRIMNSLDFSRYKASSRRPTLKIVGRLRQMGLRPRLAYAFALGIVVGLVVFSQVLNRPVGGLSGDTRDFYGTIGITENIGAETLDQTEIRVSRAEGRIDLLSFAGVFALRISLRTPERFEVVSEFDPDQAGFGGLSPGEGRDVTVRAGRRYISASGIGDSEFSLSFVSRTGDAVPVDLRLLISGDLTQSHRFILKAGDQRQ
jgi:hypothetical protein